MKEETELNELTYKENSYKHGCSCYSQQLCYSGCLGPSLESPLYFSKKIKKIEKGRDILQIISHQYSAIYDFL